MSTWPQLGLRPHTNLSALVAHSHENNNRYEKLAHTFSYTNFKNSGFVTNLAGGPGSILLHSARCRSNGKPSKSIIRFYVSDTSVSCCIDTSFVCYNLFHAFLTCYQDYLALQSLMSLTII